jgi:hypothetical protein
MARATVRYSFPAQWKPERGDIRAVLKAAGFTSTKRAHWEASDIPLADLLEAIQEVLRITKDGQALNSLSIEVVDGPA